MNLQKLKSRQITDSEVKLLTEFYTNQESDFFQSDKAQWDEFYSKNYKDLSENENLTVFEYPKMDCVIVINLTINEQAEIGKDVFVSLFTASTLAIYDNKVVFDITNGAYIPTKEEIKTNG